MSRVRNKEYETVHHLTSRIAHGVFFLKDCERNDFLSLVKRVSAFSGVELIGWCIMKNHFHLYVYLPQPPILSDDEVLARYHLLKGDAERLLSDGGDDRVVNPYAETGKECQTPSARMDAHRAEARASLAKSVRRRMYSIAEYMRMIKKWFSDAYNERNGHKGTMWEAPYGDHPMFLPEAVEDYTDIRDILAYIHLNPIRAAITDRFDGYEWSSYAAFLKGDPDAVRAMHFVYAGYESDAEIVEAHEDRMRGLLEDWKRRRAKEIARKRAEGYVMPSDPLTDECMVAQEAARAAEVQRELEQLHAERDLVKGSAARREIVCREIRNVLYLHPDFNAVQIAEVIDVPMRTVYRYVENMRKSGTLPAAA